MKIQSQSDIITNSSSEVFMVIDDLAIDKLKEVIYKMFSALNISEPFDDVLTIKKVYSYQAEENINTMILHGYVCNTPWEYWDDMSSKQREGWIKVDGYPVCTNKSEITDEMFEQAADIYVEKMKDLFYDCECGPIYIDLQIISKKPEYEEIAKNINDLIHTINYEIYSC